MESVRNVGSQVYDNVSSFGQTVLDKTQSGLGVVGSTLQSGLSAVGDKFSEIKTNVGESVQDFSSTKLVGTTTDFLNSNSIVAKFVFLLLIIILFLFCVNLGIRAINYFNSISTSQYVINGMIAGNNLIVSAQNPSMSPNSVIKRSNNQPFGLEATWTVWLFINDINSSKGTVSQNSSNGALSFSNIFNKGNNTYAKGGSTAGVATVNNAPGMYICDNTNTLRIYMDTVVSNSNYIDITNFPLKKWVNVALRIENTVMDVYINGTITSRKVCDAVPKQNYDDIQICANGGFNGNLSNLVYTNYALSVFQINNIVIAGPNLTQSTASGNILGYYSYISNMWYSEKI